MAYCILCAIYFHIALGLIFNKVMCTKKMIVKVKVLRNVHLSTGYFDTWKSTFAEVQYESLTTSYLDDLILVTQLLVFTQDNIPEISAIFIYSRCILYQK